MWWKSKYNEHNGVIRAPPPIPNKPVSIPINKVATNAKNGGTL